MKVRNDEFACKYATTLNRRSILLGGTTLAAASALSAGAQVQVAQAQQQPVAAPTGQRPNILGRHIMSAPVQPSSDNSRTS
jgi:hypothetical protein